MKLKGYRVAFPVRLVVVMMSLLSTIFLVTANLSSAATSKKKSEISAVDHTEARIKELRGAFKITTAQEELWDNLTKVMRENASDMDALTRNRAEKVSAMNAVEDMKFHRQVTKAQLDQMDQFIPPFEALYNSMSAEQKKSTDTIFQTGRHGKHKVK